MAACLALSLSACTTFDGRDESAIGRNMDLQVDCEQGAQVRFNANRADTIKANQASKELDLSKLKGIAK